jgi:hypothetical protein
MPGMIKELLSDVLGYVAFWLTGLLAASLGGLCASGILSLLGHRNWLAAAPTLTMQIGMLWGVLFVGSYHFGLFSLGCFPALRILWSPIFESIYIALIIGLIAGAAGLTFMVIH